ncbi:sigma-70 family RNA polymerase sigma factor [Nonomuraea sp. NPDC048892]|uniref:RNA polymerase sigma factor n=1 Tax=Nonomuraea sp. NPDC048892 TaxID=3154624 RepID=UPI0033E29D4E
MATDDQHLPLPMEHLPDPAEDRVAVRGDFLDFYDREYHLLVRFLLCCGAPKAEAEDAAQEAFLEVWARWDWVRDTVRRPSLYLRKVAYHKYLRPPGPRRRPLPATMREQEPPERSGPDHAVLTDESLDVLAALRELDGNSMIAMALRVDGFTAVEIADHLGLSAQKVRDLLKKARKALRARLYPARAKEGGAPR